MSIRGYKVFNPDWTCRGMKYEVGKTYKHDGPISICEAGFHFCLKVADCFNYYRFDPENKVAEVEAIGLVKSTDDKSVTDEIKILREILWPEMLELVNAGKGNTGLGNSGNENSGDRNTGDRNTGSWNSGHRNTGDLNPGNFNTGDWNTGSWNSGHRNTGNLNPGNFNTGDLNSGNFNTGDWNTGSWNSGHRNTGFFSTITPKVDIFEKPSKFTYEQAMDIPGIWILNLNYKNGWWISSENMTDEEKADHQEHETHGGYLKTIPFKDACALMWSNLSEDDKRKVMEIPNFDADIFYRITGIQVGGQNEHTD